MAQRVVGIDIGSESIRAVEVEHPSSSRARVVRVGEIALSPGSASAGEVREVHTVGSALRRLWSSKGFKSKRVVLGVGNTRVLVRDLEIPSMPSRQIRETLPFQVQDKLPVPVEDAILDFYAIEEVTGESGTMIRGLLVAALRDAVNNNIAAVRSAGLQPVAVDLVPFALARLLTDYGRSETVALVDIGGNTTNVVITTGGVPAFVRAIPAGGAEITRALADRFSLDEGRAEEVKRALGLNPKSATTQEQVYAAEVIHSSAGELLTGLRNTLSYFATQRPQNPVSRVILTGGGARLAGLADAFSELVRLPVVHGAPFTNLPTARGALSDAGTQFTIAAALAVGSAA